MTPERARALKKILDETQQTFVAENQIAKDAIAPVLRFSEPRDQELAAFICALLAYGKVAIIQNSANKILNRLGPKPVEFLVSASFEELKGSVEGWRHRLNSSEDMLLLLLLLKQVYRDHLSLENFVRPNSEDSAETLLERLIDQLMALPVTPLKRWPNKKRGFWHFLPRPSSGSACKRLNLFLRWMVGGSEMDLGLWTSFERKNLIIPVDVHVLNQARALRLTTRKTADWRTAVEITDSLKQLDPTDPTRFDFALCHLGISGVSLSQKRLR